MFVKDIIVAIVCGFCLYKLISFLVDYARKWFIFNKLPGPDGVTPIPFVGHALALRGDPDEMYETILYLVSTSPYRGKAEIGFIWLGTVPIVNVFGAKSGEVLLHSSKHIEKSFVYRFLRPWLGDGLLTSKGAKWKERRRLLTPTFHFSILNDFLSVMNEQATILTKKLEHWAETMEQFDICKPITLCTLDIICETAMGKSISAQSNQDSEYVKALYRTSELIQGRQKSPWLWPDFIFNLTKVGRDFKNCVRVLHKFTRSVIDDRNKDMDSSTAGNSRKRRQAFLDLLLNLPEGELDSDDIQEEVDTFMFEGHDTTAAALSWAIHLIGAHPFVQRKIQKELDEHLGSDFNKEITADDMKHLRYLEMVMKECLRLFPSVPIIGRITSCDCEIDGHFIPQGTNCLMFPQIINTNPYYWDDPLSFQPERFSQTNSVGRHPFAYLPFSAGPRNCIGQKFALMEEKVIMAHILRKYTVESCDATSDLKLMSDLILRSRNGIKIKLKPRKKGTMQGSPITAQEIAYD